MDTDPQVTQQFAENLRTQRRAHGLSQESLASASGMHRTAISLLERRERSPELRTIVAITRGLQLKSPAELLEGIV